jgi:cytochrome c-type biogenesis protein CcmH
VRRFVAGLSVRAVFSGLQGLHMTLWFLLALMTAAAVFAVLWPLGRRAAWHSGSELAVYRDQLREIDREQALGRLAKAEADAARVEVSRRLLAAAATASADGSALTIDGAATRRRRATALVALIVLPAGAMSLYLALGSPGMPGAPLAARLSVPPEQRPIATLVAQVEAHLSNHPEDGRGWEVLAPVYLRLGRFDDAVKARRVALRLLGATADREADLGEALTAAANGIVTAEAKEAFERALRIDPRHAKARFLVGLAAEQDGRPEEAAAIWRSLLADAPPDAPWVDVVREALARVGGRAVGTTAPSKDDMAAAAALPPERQAAMIRGMVERLADRLRRDGSDLDGWLRLVRAYTVLGERDRALAAAAAARQALGAEPDKVRVVDELVKGLGLGG